MNGTEDYQHGKTDANISNIFKRLDRIDAKLEEIQEQNKSFSVFKAQVLAISSAISLVVSSTIGFLFPRGH